MTGQALTLAADPRVSRGLADIKTRFHLRTVASFVAEAAVIYGVTEAGILSASRVPAITRARAWAAYHALAEGRTSASEISRRLGQRWPSSAIHAANTHAARHGLPFVTGGSRRARGEVAYEAPEPSLDAPFDYAAAAARRSAVYRGVL